MRKNWKFIAVLSILVILIVISVFNSYRLHQENQEYEKFISFQISSTLDILIRSIMDNDVLFEKIIVEGNVMLNPEQAQILCYNFEAISKESQNLHIFANYLNKLSPEINNETARISQDIHFFLARSVIGNGSIGDCSLGTVSLADESIDKLKQINEINNRWAEIVTVATPNGVNNINWDNVVNDKIWIFILKEFSEFAIESEWYPNLFFN